MKTKLQGTSVFRGVEHVIVVPRVPPQDGGRRGKTFATPKTTWEKKGSNENQVRSHVGKLPYQILIPLIKGAYNGSGPKGIGGGGHRNWWWW